jgi:hypothetical protein
MELTHVSITKTSDDVIHNYYKPGIELGEKQAIEIDNVHLILAQGNDMFIIADFSRGGISLDKSAQEFFTKKGRMIPYTKGIAIIDGPNKRSFLSKLFSKNKTWYPFKEVESVEEANSWFEELRKMEN